MPANRGAVEYRCKKATQTWLFPSTCTMADARPYWVKRVSVNCGWLFFTLFCRWVLCVSRLPSNKHTNQLGKGLIYNKRTGGTRAGENERIHFVSALFSRPRFSPLTKLYFSCQFRCLLPLR